MLLEIKNLQFSYVPERPLFQNFNLKIEPGKIIALAGESGCGKSTLLNLIYGTLDWQGGSIALNGQALLGPKGNIVPGEKEMKLVAQQYDLMPYSTVYDNVGKFTSNIDLVAKREKVMELLDVVGLSDFADTKPQFLSGGQQQRVAIARALSVLPTLLLLDEPFSNLDYSRKIELREKLFSYAQKKNISVLISTHDLEEIMPWLDQIIVLQEGRLIQTDTPEETYRHPYNDYVAKLLGEVNILPSELRERYSIAKRYYYPTELFISPTGLLVKVLESRFSGGYYWNRLDLDNHSIIYYSSEPLSGEIRIEFM